LRQHDVVCACDLVKAGARSSAGNLPPSLGRYPVVIATVQYQRWRANLRQLRRDIHMGKHL
jgi:hypothetical protein